MNYPTYYPGTFQNMPVQSPQMAVQPLQPQVGVMASPVSCCIVGSEEEARKAQITFDGTRTMFADFQNGRIYTKMFDFESGSIPFDIYEKVMPIAPPAPPAYVSLTDYQNHMHGLSTRIEELTVEIEKLKSKKSTKKIEEEN